MSGEASEVGPRAAHGTLADVSYAELVKRLCDDGLTGRLVLRREGVVKTTYAHQGRVVFARSTDNDDRLGEFLLRAGIIQVGHYLESASRIALGQRQGASLCEMGAIPADDLVRLVREQLTEILLGQFDWEQGEWEIVQGVEQVGELTVLNLTIEDLVVVGSRRMRGWGRIWRGLGGSVDTLFTAGARASDPRLHAALTGDEAHLLEFLSGRLKLGRLLDLGYGSDFETCRTLWGFLIAGLAERVTESSPPPALGEDWALAERLDVYNQVFTFVHGFVYERIGDLVDHFFDQALTAAATRHPQVLARVAMRNQGRVEYEDVFANVAQVLPARRLELACDAMNELLLLLLAVAAKELGHEEEAVLREHLALLGREVPQVPLADVLRRPPEVLG